MVGAGFGAAAACPCRIEAPAEEEGHVLFREKVRVPKLPKLPGLSVAAIGRVGLRGQVRPGGRPIILKRDDATMPRLGMRPAANGLRGLGASLR